MIRAAGDEKAPAHTFRVTSGGVRQSVLVSIALVFLASCTTQGDFGRDRPSVFKDEILPSIRKYVDESNGRPVSRFALTDRERLLRTYRRRIGRDMSYPTVESYLSSTVASMGLTREPPPHLGEEIRSYKNARKPVVDIAANAKVNPYALMSEIEEDITLVRRVSDLSRKILADDRLRQKRLAAMASPSPSDRDNVRVRNRENLADITYIRRVAKLRVKRYKRALDVISIANPAVELQPARKSLDTLEIELKKFNLRQTRPVKIRPGVELV